MKIFSKYQISFKKFFKTATPLFVSLLVVAAVAQAGSLSPLAAPAATSYTLEDIYKRLSANTAATEANHTLSTTTSPASTFYTLTQIYNAIPTIYATDLLATSTYLGVAGTIAVKSGDADASSAATSTNKLMLTPAVGYYNGSTATVSTTSTAFTATNIRSGTYLFGVVGSLTALLYGDNNANQVLTTASAPGSIAVISGNTAVASSSIQGTSFVLTVPQGYYSGADSVTVSTSSVNMFVNQEFQTKDDWVNSGGTTGEYTAEEATWTTVSGSPFAGYGSINYAGSGGDLDLYSGTVKQDTRTGLWWSDISAVGASASSTGNVFTLSADGSRPTGGFAVGFCDALNTANFAGYADWYLPTQKQLMQAYVNGSANNLPNPGNYFWSSTEHYGSTAVAWLVYLGFGFTDANTKVTSNYVRCVRSS